MYARGGFCTQGDCCRCSHTLYHTLECLVPQRCSRAGAGCGIQACPGCHLMHQNHQQQNCTLAIHDCHVCINAKAVISEWSRTIAVECRAIVSITEQHTVDHDVGYKGSQAGCNKRGVFVVRICRTTIDLNFVKDGHAPINTRTPTNTQRAAYRAAHGESPFTQHPQCRKCTASLWPEMDAQALLTKAMKHGNTITPTC